jgi:hypothetical protein
MEGHVRQASQCPQLDFAPIYGAGPVCCVVSYKDLAPTEPFFTAVGSKVSAGLNTDSERVHKIMHGTIT